MVRKLKTVAWVLRGGHSGPVDEGSLGSLGTKTNLFHQGVAKEVDDPNVIAATMRKPGVILRRPIGSIGPFKEHPDLPTHLPGDQFKGRPEKRRAKVQKRPSCNRRQSCPSRGTGLRERTDAARKRSPQRRRRHGKGARRTREGTVAKAQAAFEEAKRDHDKRASTITRERAALEKRSQA